MLPDQIKAQIQSAYRQMLDSRGLMPRAGQRQMIADIARCLGEIPPPDSASDAESPGPVCAIEAGTGTGKTLAYLLATMPVAKYLDMKVVVATATIALQEQVLHKDIPQVLADSGLDFSAALAKGRGHYLCLTRLKALLQGDDEGGQLLLQDYYPDGPDEFSSSPPANLDLYKDMQDALAAGQWQGDRAQWRQPLADADWQRLTMDNAGCMGPKCADYQDCCFYKAREQAAAADCIVANQDLLLADLALGGGAILPAPEQTLYIIDEAHHLPHKSNSHFAASTRLQAGLQWLERLQRMLRGLAQDGLLNEEPQEEMQTLISRLRRQIEEIRDLLLPLFEGDEIRVHNNIARRAFSHGVVPEELQNAAANMDSHLSRLSGLLRSLAEALKTASDEAAEGSSASKAEVKTGSRAGEWFPVVWAMARRAEGSLRLWRSFARSDQPGMAPTARWLSLHDNSARGEQQSARGSQSTRDITLSSAPVLAAQDLQQHLWQRCGGAVLTSATLTALGDFEMFRLRAGLPEHSLTLRIASPFPFADAASFRVPRLGVEPGQTQQHTEAIAQALPELLAEDKAALMLFSSRRQMREVIDLLPEEWRERVLCQDDHQKAQLLQLHRQRVDAGESSVIFGLASFAEGVDLPGAYCTHVLIAKIPFAVPDDPIETTLAEWLESQGENPFMRLTVPDAAFRLVQASGRLLRHEDDTGSITLFDERIVSKRYGKAILDSLPPYRRELLEMDMA